MQLLKAILVCMMAWPVILLFGAITIIWYVIEFFVTFPFKVIHGIVCMILGGGPRPPR